MMRKGSTKRMVAKILAGCALAAVAVGVGGVANASEEKIDPNAVNTVVGRGATEEEASSDADTQALNKCGSQTETEPLDQYNTLSDGTVTLNYYFKCPTGD